MQDNRHARLRRLVTIAALSVPATWGASAAPWGTADTPAPRSSPWGTPVPDAAAPKAEPAPKAAPPPAPAIVAPAAPVVAAPSSPAPAAAAAPFPSTPTVTKSATGVLVENLTLAMGPVVYRIPRADLRGTPLSPSEVSALLDPASTEAVQARFLRLSASEVAIPQMTAEQTVGGVRQAATYRDILLTGVKDGQIASASAGGGSFEAESPTGRSRGGFARMAVENADIGLGLALYAGSGVERTEPKRLYGAFAIDGLTLSDEAGATTRIAHFGGGEVRAAPTRGGLSATLAVLGAAPPELTKADPAERKRVFTAIAETLDSFQITSLEATGIEFSQAKTTAETGRIARIAYTAQAGDRPGEIRLDALDVAGDAAHVRIGSVVVGGFSLKPLLTAAQDLADSGENGPDPAQWRKLVPASVALRITDLSVAKGSGAQSASAPFALAAIEIAADKPVDGTPSDLRIALRGLSFPVEQSAEQGGLKGLDELGYSQIDASLGLASGWNEPSREVVLRDFSVRAANMGSATVSAVLGNVSRDVFSPDSTIAAVALVGVTAKSFDMALENGGLFERIIEREAKRQKRTPDDLRREYGIAAAVGVPAMLGNSAQAKTLGAAVARFIAKPGRLTIQARVKDGPGLGIADFAAGPDPASVLERLDVTATAQ